MRLPDRHLLRVIWSCVFACGLILVFWSTVAARACGDELVALGGYGTTRGLGEAGPAPEAAVTFASRRVALEGSWYGAAKLESGRGWGARGAAELRWRGLGAGMAYTYRDGGAWVKSYLWARASITRGPVMLAGDWAVGGYNRERRVEARVNGRAGAFVLQPRVFVERHLQGTGWGAAVMVGLAVGGAR